MLIDPDEMMRPVSEENPAGENKEYDPLFMELSELATGTPANEMGDSVIEGTDPDWRKLKKNCEELWEGTRDLRVAVYLTIAYFSLNGLEGMSDGLSLIEYLVNEQWENFYPQLDPDDDNDPTERVNIFSMLSPAVGSYNDGIKFPNKIRLHELVPGLPYSLRDYLIMTGELDKTDSKLNEQLFRAEMSTISPEVLAGQLELTDKIIEQLNGICERVNDVTEAGTLSFEVLAREMKLLKKCYEAFQIEVPEDNPGEPEAGDEGNDSSGSGTGGKAAAVNIATYVPANRQEALMLLEKGAAYFAKAEPTNPVPYLIKRALKMANMSFMELLGDIDMNAVDKGKEIFGLHDDEDGDDGNGGNNGNNGNNGNGGDIDY